MSKPTKNLWRFGAIALAIFIAWIAPRLYGEMMARPLYGHFPFGSCDCGHEMFIRIDEHEAFDSTPGHRRVEHLGTVIRTSNTVAVVLPNNPTPLFELRYTNQHHSARIPGATAEWTAINQIANPWRIWLPRLLPE